MPKSIFGEAFRLVSGRSHSGEYRFVGDITGDGHDSVRMAEVYGPSSAEFVHFRLDGGDTSAAFDVGFEFHGG